jgi:hypothetical protein
MPYETFKSGPRKGQPKKLVDRVVRYLEEVIGCKEFTCKGKYRQFTRPYDSDYYFVGSNGAVRAGRAASNSILLTQLIHAKMKVWEWKN